MIGGAGIVGGPSSRRNQRYYIENKQSKTNASAINVLEEATGGAAYNYLGLPSERNKTKDHKGGGY